VAAVQDPLIPRYTRVPSPYGEPQAREFLAEQRRRREEGIELSLLVVDPDGDDLLGSVGARVDRDSGRAEIGYWVASEARGRGVATRAVVLLGAWLFEALGLARLQITHRDRTTSPHSASPSVPASLARALLRSYELVEGRPIDVTMFAALPGELISRTRSSATRGSP